LEREEGRSEHAGTRQWDEGGEWRGREEEEAEYSRHCVYEVRVRVIELLGFEGERLEDEGC